ncbi:hypothetical protein MRX96_040831 [Rhipicephalus microplus]
MDDQDRYRPSEDAKALAQAMMPPPGALPARPVRNTKHKIGASFGGIPFDQLESLQSWTLQASRDNMVMAWKTAAADAVRHLSQAPRGDPMCTSAPAAEQEMDMSASRKRPRPQDSSDDEADTRRKLVQANPQGESDSSADSSDSRLSYDSQYTEDSTDRSASSTTTGVASVIQVDPLL